MLLTALKQKPVAEDGSVTLTAIEMAFIIERLTACEKPPEPALPALISVEEICAELKIARQTLWLMRRSNNFIEPVSVTKRRVLFRRSDFLTWLATRHA